MEVESEIKISPSIRQIITPKQAWHYRIVPNRIDTNHIEFYISDNSDLKIKENELSFLLSKPVHLTPIEEEEIEKKLLINYGENSKDLPSLFTDPEKFLENLIVEASRLKSSDIHIESFQNRCRIRFRVNGRMLERFEVAKPNYQGLINRVKVSAGLDIAEKRIPQDGRIQFQELGESFDMRVNVLPTLHGEKVVLRLLKKDGDNLEINKLGFAAEQLVEFKNSIQKPNGIILVSGPTGSGKTTTLYATLNELNKEEVNILTVEDPIEYTLPGVNHVQVNEKIGLTFASALRAFLRQDPDIIMLGEIRDGETANMAIRAALTGHLVLSTIHTNSAWGTISRLVDMGVPPFLLANTLNLSVAQRLIRVLCPKCKLIRKHQNENLNSFLSKNYNLKNDEFAFPKGCSNCFHTGFIGRTAIYEVISIDDFLKNQINLNEFDVNSYLKKKGIKSLQENALALLLNYETSIEEVFPLLIE